MILVLFIFPFQASAYGNRPHIVEINSSKQSRYFVSPRPFTVRIPQMQAGKVTEELETEVRDSIFFSSLKMVDVMLMSLC
jgi:hypothetical protein